MDRETKDASKADYTPKPKGSVQVPRPLFLASQSTSKSFHGYSHWELGGDPETIKQLKAVFRQRNQIYQKIVKMEKVLSDRKTMSLAQLTVMSRNLTAAYTEFSTFHSQVISLIPDEDLNEQENEYSMFEELYTFVSEVVEELILEAKGAGAAIPAEKQVIVHQQPLKAPIPTFDGSYAGWPKFKAIFNDLMSKSGDSDALKLYHLDKALIGSAAGILDARTINEGNYNQAWQILTERYENERVIIESHIRGLFSLKRMTSESSKDLRALLDEATRHVENLRFLKQELLGVSEHMVVFLISNALDKSTRKAWESTMKKGNLPKYEPTVQFLKTRCQILENCELAMQPTSSQSSKSKPTFASSKPQVQKCYSNATNLPSPQLTNTERCVFCGGQHRNFQCDVLGNLTAAERLDKIRTTGVCFNCLRKGHQSKECPSSKTCKKCQKHHHTLLHGEREGNTKQEAKSNVSIPKPSEESSTSASQAVSAVEIPTVSTSCSCNYSTPTKTVLLLTAVVHLMDAKKQLHPCRVLLDSGSQVNFISEKMANLLGLPKQPANVQITGIGAIRTMAREKINVKLHSRDDAFHATMECLITPKVTGTLPSSKIDVSDWEFPSGIFLADVEFHKPSQVDMLIGAQHFFDLLKPGKMQLAPHLPQLRDSHLGWVVAGVINDRDAPIRTSIHSNMASVNDIEKMMYQFWQIEEVPNVDKHSAEEQFCEAHFMSTHRRDSTGRFMVKLPFKDNVGQLADCRDIALKRFLLLERRFLRDPDLKTQYIEFLREYESLQHCHQISEADDPPHKSKYYLPHHAILRPASSSTKCRVVFDASAKPSSSALSLNDVLHVGPVVQSDLFTITIRFRKYRFVFSADVSKMYRQVLLMQDDTCYLRIFWREDPSQPLRVLELNTVTYGTASAPFQATRCLIQLAEDDSSILPEVARIIKEDFYVDDVLSGADTIEMAVEYYKQLKSSLARGGFPLTKWCSNSEEFLQHVPPEEQEKQQSVPEYEANEMIKLLGLIWDPKADTFHIETIPASSVSNSNRATKRIIYSEVAKIFDPLGLFSPVIVASKLLIQQLWKAKQGWDDPVEEDCQQKWNELQQALPQLSVIQVPRRVTNDNAVYFELHGFADASAVAYGACCYVRSVFPNGSAELMLLASKSKVAPLHDLSIPRKELCAALLLTRLMQKVIPAMQMVFREVVLWSDSTIVLAWVKKPLDQLQIFVRNRVSEICSNTAEYQWKYIRSKNNPADIVSRGQLPEALSQNRLWHHGPEFLSCPNYEMEIAENIPPDPLPEMKVFATVRAVVDTSTFQFLHRFSDFRKVQRIMAYIRRFLDNCRKKDPCQRLKKLYLTIGELRRSSHEIFRAVQHIHLSDEIKLASLGESSKRIGNLRPVYTDGLLRVGGRLDKSALPFESKHPVILPDKDPVVKNFVRCMHRELVHVGQTGLTNAIRQRYWLLNARSTIRQVTRSCVRCFRTNPVSTTQLMGSLPQSRVSPSPPFAATGVDYAGPLWIKQGTYRPKIVKAYVAVYVCMATKAIHLEAVSDLSTNAFLASLKRFVSRRGLCQRLYSDNATNFKGAHHEMNELFAQFQNQQTVHQIHQFCQTREMEWHFIPPNAPEFGGLWESAVKLAKTHLKRIVGNSKLTFEELSTVLAEIEAVLNSRPLFTVSNDPADPDVITPAHFLIGRPLVAPAEPSLENLNANRLDRWQHLQVMRNHFWKAWSRDYLNTLQPRKKYLRTTPNIRVGMIVLLHEKTQPPLSWKLGRISAVYPGDDGLVRVVDVFSEGSSYRRPITKVSILPIKDNVPVADIREEC